MADINKALDILLRAEGGYVNDPSDPGGATYRGITLTVFQSYYGKAMTAQNLRSMTYDQTVHIYKAGYWNKVKGDDIRTQAVADIIFDFAVNSGVSTAVKKVQQVLIARGHRTVKADGLFGPVTLKAVNEDKDQPALFNDIKAARVRYYESLMKNPSLKKFLKGWMNRLALYHFR